MRRKSTLIDRKSQLPKGTVESLAREVIRCLTERDTEFSAKAPTEEQIAHLCHALLSDDDHAGASFIQDIGTVGTTIEVVCLEYLACAARMLGDWWDNDEISFMSVTLGASRMYAIMRGMQHRFAPRRNLPKRSALFASVPGETHTLGVNDCRFATDGSDIRYLE